MSGKAGRRKAAGFIACAMAILVMGSLGVMIWRQVPTRVQAAKYEICGVDVSHYQGEVDWNTLREQGISFAYIKATEGSSYADVYFEQNVIGAEQAGVTPGAYHFFSFDSPAESQAEWFIETMRKLWADKEEMSAKQGEKELPERLETILIPAVDIEYYGDKRQNPPGESAVRNSLQKMLDILETEYGVKPMIYTTYPFYRKYIQGYFDEYPLWLRNVYYEPGEDWTLWQYADRVVLDGYAGEERYIDMDVFYGSAEEFEKLKMKKPLQ